MIDEPQSDRRIGWWLLLTAVVATAAIYWPGLPGGYLFDDYPNIVNNTGLQIDSVSLSDLSRAALSSPSSDFKRPLASLSFAANYLASGLDPYWMKLTNLVIHLLNGLLVFLLARVLLGVSADSEIRRTSMVAAIIAAGWLVLPINLTPVLYVVQRMESLANGFVLLGLLGYTVVRVHMRWSAGSRRVLLCALWIAVPTFAGLLAKETAVMLPLYALLVELVLFQFRSQSRVERDRRIIVLFLMMLILPMLVGLAWLLPGVLDPVTWASREFTLGTRLLSEARIVVNYIAMTLLPTPGALSFYHDEFRTSTGALSPWTTSASLFFIAGAMVLTWRLRVRAPLVCLGLGLFFAGHLLTATILPLELIFEHRNYFSSFGLLLAIVPTLAVPRTRPFSLPRHALLAGLLLLWSSHTAMLAHAWGNPLRLASELAARGPASARAQYGLGHIYVVYSDYQLDSPFTTLAYKQLEHAARLPAASILPEQALILMSAHLHKRTDNAWWDAIAAELPARKPSSEDLSALASLVKCKVDGYRCDLPQDQMVRVFLAALSHPNPSSRLLGTYSGYAWNVMGDRELAMKLAVDAVAGDPAEPAYRITLIKMLTELGRNEAAKAEIERLRALNTGGRLQHEIDALRLRLAER